MTTTGHAAGYFADAPYDDEGPFVEWPANAFSLAVAVPSAVVAGVLCAPLGVATRSGVVSTMAGGESVAKEVVIKGDTITFTRDIAVQGLSGSVTYTAKLVDGALKGTGDVKLGDVGTPTPFTAKKAK